MLNNRQGGRRRGRGGQRPQGGGGRPDQGNRIDNRARGNAAQLLEKYKNLARDAQMSGDRVNAEYYYQFADHYFRVLNENRARFEEQRRQRGEDGQDEEFEGEDNRQEFSERQERDDRRRDRDRDYDRREERAGEDRQREQRADDAGSEARDDGDRRPRRGRNRREQMNGAHEADEPAAFDASVLPPSIAPVEAVASEGEEATAPRRRGRRPRVVESLPEDAPDAA